MHEYPVTLEIVRIAEKTAREKGGLVKAIHLVVGEDSGFIGESIQMYFDVISEGTLCEGARLTIRDIKPKMRCDRCGALFERKRFSFTCPHCGGDGSPTEIGKEFYGSLFACQLHSKKKEIPHAYGQSWRDGEYLRP